MASVGGPKANNNQFLAASVGTPAPTKITDDLGARHLGLILHHNENQYLAANVMARWRHGAPYYQQAALPLIFDAIRTLNGAGRSVDFDEVYAHLAQQGTETMEARAVLELIPVCPLDLELADAQTLARDYEEEMLARPEPEENPFEFSTDADLDDRLGSIEWLWPGYIPRGFVTLLTAEQDAGKSTVAQGLCDTVLRGTQWPDGTLWTPEDDTKLLWIDTEGSIALFRERAAQWGIPRGRFILPPDGMQELAIDNHVDWLWIERAIERFSPPLVVIDALSGAHSGKENASDDMKIIMKKLGSLAQKYNIAIVAIHHLSKPAPGVPMFPVTIHRLRGSSSITQYCRSILALGTPDPARPEDRRLDVIKLNLARKPEPVGYQLTDMGPTWGIAPEPPRTRYAVDDAIDFLEVALANGMRPVADVEDEAKQAGLGDSALKNARKQLNVKTIREGGSTGRWFMKLPDYTRSAEQEDETHA